MAAVHALSFTNLIPNLQSGVLVVHPRGLSALPFLPSCPLAPSISLRPFDSICNQIKDIYVMLRNNEFKGK